MMNRKQLSLVGAVAALSAATASAFAAGATSPPPSAIDHIAAAAHPRTAADALDPATAASIRAEDATGAAAQVGRHHTSESRVVGSLPDGRSIYVIPTDEGRLCIAAEQLAEACGNPLTRSEPATFTIVDSDGPGGSAPVAYGVAADGVSSLSFAVSGRSVTVRVRDNLFVFRGRSGDDVDGFSPATVRFADGSTTILR